MPIKSMADAYQRAVSPKDCLTLVMIKYAERNFPMLSIGPVFFNIRVVGWYFSFLFRFQKTLL